MKIEHAALTDTGRVREKNEDSVGVLVPDDAETLLDKGALFVVADGMGGHRGGEIASGLAVETIESDYSAAAGDDPGAMLLAAFEKANTSILNAGTADSALFGMGTTCTAMVIRRGLVYVAHVGDSRAYRLRAGAIEQITDDHSLVGEMVRSGIITEEDARTHPKRNVITRSLGIQESVVADTLDAPLTVEAGDSFLLCSDGLTAYAEDEDLRDAVSGATPEAACRALIDFANAGGGRDNITVIVVTVAEL